MYGFIQNFGGVNISNKLNLISPIPPSTNHYLAYKVVKTGNKNLAMSYQTKETKDFKKSFIQYVKEEMNKQGFIPSTNKYQFIHYDVITYFPRIDMDNSNYYKVVLDSLTEAGVWIDDNIVIERCKRIYYDSQNPRLEIKIYYSDFIGIFDNQSQFDEFLSNCVHCVKYKEGKCNILQKSQEGRIQEEINNFQCFKYKEKRGS